MPALPESSPHREIALGVGLAARMRFHDVVNFPRSAREAELTCRKGWPDTLGNDDDDDDDDVLANSSAVCRRAMRLSWRADRAHGARCTRRHARAPLSCRRERERPHRYCRQR